MRCKRADAQGSTKPLHDSDIPAVVISKIGRPTGQPACAGMYEELLEASTTNPSTQLESIHRWSSKLQGIPLGQQ